MKNFEILNVNHALGELADEPLKGKFKFKVFHIKAELEKKAEVIGATLQDVEDEEERLEILEQEQEVKINKLTEEELDTVELSIRQIGMLQPIITFKEESE